MTPQHRASGPLTGAAALLVIAPLSFGSAFAALPGTGQTACYDTRGPIPCPQSPDAAFFGQDAQTPGPTPQYQENGDGTVTDTVTGLIWEKAFRTTPWAEAVDTAAAATTGGYTDWRIPTIRELYSLILFSGQTGHGAAGQQQRPANARPYLDTTAFAFEYPSRGRYIDAQYISATVYQGVTMGRDRSFFGVNFADGRIKAYPQSGGPEHRPYYLRLVRGNPAYGQNRFHDNGDGTISEQGTGLMWQQADANGLSWQQALHHCQTLTLAGLSDWRLPNAKELQSIVDYRRSPQATQSPAIDPLFHSTTIMDEGGQRNWPFYWTSTTHLDGPTPGSFAVYIAFGEATGAPPPPTRPVPGSGGPPGFDRQPPPFDTGHTRRPGGGQPGLSGPVVMDVHGAGAQRSSPKSGDPQARSQFMGPQGDALRTENAARCVRGPTGR